LSPKLAGAIAVLLAVLMLGVGIGAGIQKSKAADETLLPPATAAPKSAVPGAKRSAIRERLFRAELARVARDFGVAGRLDCVVVKGKAK
jgi:hypothetical protein